MRVVYFITSCSFHLFPLFFYFDYKYRSWLDVVGRRGLCAPSGSSVPPIALGKRKRLCLLPRACLGTTLLCTRKAAGPWQVSTTCGTCVCTQGFSKTEVKAVLDVPTGWLVLMPHSPPSLPPPANKQTNTTKLKNASFLGAKQSWEISVCAAWKVKQSGVHE